MGLEVPARCTIAAVRDCHCSIRAAPLGETNRPSSSCREGFHTFARHPALMHLSLADSCGTWVCPCINKETQKSSPSEGLD
eukprot:2412040-Pleurochrysis_carterae.AAC.1